MGGLYPLFELGAKLQLYFLICEIFNLRAAAGAFGLGFVASGA
jgi:hypothetical protein